MQNNSRNILLHVGNISPEKMNWCLGSFYSFMTHTLQDLGANTCVRACADPYPAVKGFDRTMVIFKTPHKDMGIAQRLCLRIANVFGQRNLSKLIDKQRGPEPSDMERLYTTIYLAAKKPKHVHFGPVNGVISLITGNDERYNTGIPLEIANHYVANRIKPVVIVLTEESGPHEPMGLSAFAQERCGGYCVTVNPHERPIAFTDIAICATALAGGITDNISKVRRPGTPEGQMFYNARLNPA